MKGAGMKRLIFCMSLSLCFCAVVLYGENKKEITAFYPSPYGEYEQLKSFSLLVANGNNEFFRTTTPDNGSIAVENSIFVGKEDFPTDNSIRFWVNSGTGIDAQNTSSFIYTSDGRLLLGDGVANEVATNTQNNRAVFLVTGENDSSLIYTSDGRLLLGDGVADDVNNNDDNRILLIRPETRDGFEDAEIMVGNYNDGNFNITGVSIDQNGQPCVYMGVNNQVKGFFVGYGTNSRLALSHVQMNDGEADTLISDSSVLITSIGAGNGNNAITISAAGGICLSPHPGTLYAFNNIDSVAFVDAGDNNKALAWGIIQNNNPVEYGYLGGNLNDNKVEIGATTGNLFLTTNGNPAIGVDGFQRVEIGGGVGLINLDSSLTVNGANWPNIARFRQANSWVVITSQGDVKLNQGDVLIDNGRLAVGTDSPFWSYGGKGIRAYINGYAVVSDVYIRNPVNNSVSSGWVSNILSSSRIDYRDCAYTADAHKGTCPKGYVAIGFDCTGSCEGSNMRLRCCRLK